jgi:hypothetical protein
VDRYGSVRPPWAVSLPGATDRLRFPAVTDRDAADLDVRLEWPGDSPPPVRRRRPLRAGSTGPAPEGGAEDDDRVRVRVGESGQVSALARQVEVLGAEVASLRSEVAELRARMSRG